MTVWYLKTIAADPFPVPAEYIAKTAVEQNIPQQFPFEQLHVSFSADALLPAAGGSSGSAPDPGQKKEWKG